MKIAAYADMYDASPTTQDMPWDDLVSLLSEPIRTECSPCPGSKCPAKNTMAWSAAELLDKRNNRSVKAVTAIVFDLDKLTESISAIEARLKGLNYIIHSTHSHRPLEPRYRLVVELAEPIPKALWGSAWRQISNEFKLTVDQACKDPCRLFFLPSVSTDGVFYFSSGDGEAYRYREKKPDERQKPMDLRGLRTILLAAKRRKQGSTKPDDVERYNLLCRILTGDPLALEGERAASVNKAASMCAYLFPPNTPVAGCVEMLRSSLATMPGVEPVSHWIDMAEKSYQRASERRDSAPTVVALNDDWKGSLITKADGTIKGLGHNAYLILKNASETTFRFDSMAKNIVVCGKFAGVSLDVLDTVIADWLQSEWSMTLSGSEISSRIARLAHENEFNPLQEYLGALQWDQTCRVDTFFKDFCATPHTSYVKSVGRAWFISLVARAMEPGCQVDTVLVLEGRQAAGKTSLLRTLGQDWYCVTDTNFADKDAKMLASSSWIVELGELVSLRRSQLETIKTFISTTSDKIRVPYGKVPIVYPRQCVFVGTTNEEEYLFDRTGNRRWWPVKVREIDISAVFDVRDQLFAEALHYYQQGVQWHLTEHQQKDADVETEARLQESSIVDKVIQWYNGQSPAPLELNTLTVAQQALLLSAKDITRAVQIDIGHALLRLGYKKKRERGVHGLVNVYRRLESVKESEAA